MRILTITNHVPYPATSGAPLRTYNILHRLAKTHEVYLAAFTATPEQIKGVAHLLEFCREVVTVELKSLKELLDARKILTAIVHGEPPELRSAFSEDLARGIQKLADAVEFDLVQIEHGSMGMYLQALPARLQKRAVWVLHDIDFDKFVRIARIERRMSARLRAWIHARMMKQWQPSFAGLFNLCVTMSEADRQTLLSENRNLKIAVSPNGVDTYRYRPLASENNGNEMLFIGNMGYEPNVDAAVYFCREILPLIREAVTDSKLRIVGINPTKAVKRLEGDGVFVTGAVPDVVPYYMKSKVCVVPLRAGSGTRLKILEAMALGRPVVSTSLGCEGLGATEGEHILIADDSKTFAEKVMKLLTDPALRDRLSENARDFVVKRYDWSIITEALISDFNMIAAENREALADHLNPTATNSVVKTL